MATSTLSAQHRSRSTYFDLYPDRVKGSESTTTPTPAPAVAPPALALPVKARGIDKDRDGYRRDKEGGGDHRARKGSITQLFSLAGGKDKTRERDAARQTDRDHSHAGERRPSATSVFLGKALNSISSDPSPRTPNPPPPPSRQQSRIEFKPLSPPSTSKLPPAIMRMPSAPNLSYSAQPPRDRDHPPMPPRQSSRTSSAPGEHLSRAPSFNTFPIVPRTRPASLYSSSPGSETRSPSSSHRRERPVSSVFPSSPSFPPRRTPSTANLHPSDSLDALSFLASSPPPKPGDSGDSLLEDLFAGPAPTQLEFDEASGTYRSMSASTSLSSMDDLVATMNSHGSKSRSSSLGRRKAREAAAGSLHAENGRSEVGERNGAYEQRSRTREGTGSSTASSASFASMTAGPSPCTSAPPLSREPILRPSEPNGEFDPTLVADADIAHQMARGAIVPSAPSIDSIIKRLSPSLHRRASLTPTVPASASFSSLASSTQSTSSTSSRSPSPSVSTASPPSRPRLTTTPSSASTVKNTHIKSIEDIIREHAGATFLSPKQPAPTPAQAVAESARSRETSYESDQSRGSVNSIDEEIRASLQNQHRALEQARGFLERPPPPSSPDSADRSDSRSMRSSHSTQLTPRQGSPAGESDAVLVERELATLLKSPRLTRLLTLKRTPNQGLTVSLADVGSPTGHPVIVFLGLGCVRYLIALYDEMADALGLRLICVDRWGLGRTSEVPDSKRGFVEWSSVIGEVVDQLALHEYSILGHSAGGPYALAASLRAPNRVRGTIHLLAPWVSTSADSLAGAFKYLKYVPTRVLRTAQTAEFKMQAWRLGKPPTIVHEGIGYNHRAAVSSTEMSPGSPVFALWGVDPTGSRIDEDDLDGMSDKTASLPDSSPDREISPSSLYPAGRVAGVHGRSLQGKGSKTFLSGLFGGGSTDHRSPKSSSSSDNTSLRSSSGHTNSRKNFTPPSTLRAGTNGSPSAAAPGLSRRASVISTSGNSFRTPEPSSISPTAGVGGGLSGLELANGLLRASHAESLRGSTSDLMVLLERTSKPWGFRYSDIGTGVKVWQGDKDDRISLSSVKWLETEMVDCKVKIVPGADHSLMTNGRVMIQVLESISSEWNTPS